MKNLITKKEEKEIYQKSSELFNNCCAICGSPDIQLHHIRYGGLRGGRKTYMGNVIPLCKKHHDWAHSNKKENMNKLIDIINKRMNVENNIN